MRSHFKRRGGSLTSRAASEITRTMLEAAIEGNVNKKT